MSTTETHDPQRPGASTIPFEAGKLFNSAFRTWFNTLPTVLLTMVVFAIPIAILTVLLAAATKGAPREELSIPLLVVTIITPLIVGIVVNQVYVGAVTFASVQSLRGKHASPGDAIKLALRRIGPLVGTSLIVGVCVVLGVIALIVPGIMILCAYMVTAPVVVCEGLGGMAALKRSADLTRGNRGTIFLSLFLITLVSSIVVWLVTKVSEELTIVIGDTLSQVAQQVLSTFIGSVGNSLVAVIYFALRQRKDGVEIDDIARVFD